MTLDEAIRIAVDAHAGQLDKAGKPYILHPLRVMMTVEGPFLDSARKVAVLHDVVEDSEWTLESLDAKFGLTVEEQAALRLLTHGEHEDYATYIERVAGSPLADRREGRRPARQPRRHPARGSYRTRREAHLQVPPIAEEVDLDAALAARALRDGGEGGALAATGGALRRPAVELAEGCPGPVPQVASGLVVSKLGSMCPHGARALVRTPGG